MSPTRWGRLAVCACGLLVIGASGCSMAPKSFRKIHDPAAITRARAVSLGTGVTPVQRVPSLIDRLEDSDPVVRLAAYEQLLHNEFVIFQREVADIAEAIEQGDLAAAGHVRRAHIALSFNRIRRASSQAAP